MQTGFIVCIYNHEDLDPHTLLDIQPWGSTSSSPS